MLKQRIITAIIALAALAVVLFVLPAVAARAVIAAIVLVGAWEWGGFLFNKAQLGQKLAYVVFTAALMAFIFTRLPDPRLLEIVFKISLGWWFVALIWMFFYPTRISRPVSWMCGTLVLIPAWSALDYLYLLEPDLLLFALLIVWIADIGAYFTGRGFGRVKLAPKISPGKTWEGVLGGLTAVVLLAAAGSNLLAIDIAVLVPFCAAVSLLSIVGDLTVSMFKREADVKDSGRIFPGHGGVLDRIDSLTAAMPLFALALSWAGLQ